MTNRGKVLWGLIALVFVGFLTCIMATPAFAQASIPGGSTITYAQLSIWAGGPGWTASDTDAWEVRVHPVSEMWLENSVTWNNFIAASFPTVPYGAHIGSFFVLGGWNIVEVTTLVQDWVDGSIQNLGLLLRQDGTAVTPYFSSENTDLGLRPKLEIWYTDPSGENGYILIQRSGDAEGGVSDAYIWDRDNRDPDGIFYRDRTGNGELLYTGYHKGTKLSLLRFHFIVEREAPGTGTPGFWKNHPIAWPVDEVEVGCSLYTMDEAIALLNLPVRGDKTISMFAALVSAKLNVMIGNDNSCIADDIVWADEWMCEHPAGNEVKAGGEFSPWRDAEPVHKNLDDYNNGDLPCADHRGD